MCKRLGGLLVLVSLFVAGATSPAWPQDDPTDVRALDLIPRIVDLIGRTEAFGVASRESGDEVQITISTDVLFAFDKATLSSEAQRRIEEAAEQITEKAQGTVRIEGHTDAKGSDAYNLRLSELRADAVRAALAELVGADVTFITRGFGETRPVAPNTKKDGSDNPQGRARNRRVEISFSKTGEDG